MPTQITTKVRYRHTLVVEVFTDHDTQPGS